MENELTLGQAIRDRRKEIGITIKELGRIIGLSEQAISQYELDKRIPDEATLVKISVALKTSAIKLLSDSGKDEEEIKSFYDTVIAFTKNIKHMKNQDNPQEDPQSYYLEQYIRTLGYEIISDEKDAYLILRTKNEEYEITMNNLDDIKASSKSFVEYKLHEVMNKSRRIGK
ncbi:MAG: helix-turn-helix transcriptional regulator [Clostridiaceae bacterium]